MPKAGKGGWYAVAAGRQVGIYQTWDACCEQVKGFSSAKYKKFSTKGQAEEYIRANDKTCKNRTELSNNKETEYGSALLKRVGQAVSPSNYYAVARGHCPGVYYSWPDCKAQVTAFNKPLYRKFISEDEALDFCAKNAGPTSRLTSTQLESKQVPELDLSHSFDELPDEGFSPTRPDGDVSPLQGDTALSEEEDVDDTPVLREIAALLKKSHHHQSDQAPGCMMEEQNTRRHIVYTDGSCINQGKGRWRAAGIGVYWGRDDTRNLAERLWGAQTNQRAELWAAIRALQTGISGGYRKLEVRTDSQYTIKGATQWIKRWKTNGYRDVNGNPVKNQELFRLLESASHMVDVRWVHVKAHQGEPGNEAADLLAKSGARKPLPVPSMGHVNGVIMGGA